MKFLRGSLVGAIWLLLLAGLARAQGGPPLLTDDPGTPGPGKFEINIAFTAEVAGSQQSYKTPLIDANYGIGDHIQLKVEVPWVVQHEREEHTLGGLGQPLIGVKWRFFDAKKYWIDASVYPQIEFNPPTSSSRRGIVEENTTFLLPVEVQKEFGDFTIGAEVGYEVVEEADDEWIYGLAIGYKFFKKLELLAEIHGESDVRFSENEIVVNLGLRFEIAEHFEFLLAGGRGLEQNPDFVGYVGVQITF